MRYPTNIPKPAAAALVGALLAAGLVLLGAQGDPQVNESEEPTQGSSGDSSQAGTSTKGSSSAPGGAFEPEALAARQDERASMVRTQIARRGVTDPLVLEAMRTVPREHYMPQRARGLAYADRPVPIGEGQTISQPYIVAFMTEQLELKGGETVLEVGTGLGYQASILGRIADEVHTIEIVEPLCRQARRNLAEHGYDNVTVHCGNGYAGYPPAAPFDAIIVTAAPEQVPQALLDQLAPGGRLVLPVGPQYATQDLRVVTRTADGYHTESLIPVRFVPMTGDSDEPEVPR